MSKPTSLTYNSPTFKLGHHHEEQWLDAARTPFVKAKSLLKPYPEELMGAHDVSPIVNSAKYDGADCTQPVQMTRYLAAGSCPCCEQH